MPRAFAEAVDPNLPRYWIQPYYGSFNGLRGIAVLAVFTQHYAKYWGASRPQYFTWTGVDLFFVLSGFLITGILYDSLQAPRFFRDFYVRRALRIFPLFYTVFLLLLVLTPLLHLSYLPEIWTYAIYVGNLLYPFSIREGRDIAAIYKIVGGHPTVIAQIAHLWSLCVEEHFYLLWPATVWLVRDRKRLLWLCVALCAGIISLRFGLNSHHNIRLLIYSSSYTRFDSLLVGAWMALWLRGKALSHAQLRRLSFLLFWLPFIVVVVMILRLPGGDAGLALHSRFITTIGFTLIALAAAGLMLRSLDDTSRLSRVLRLWPLRSLGTISYGFYVIHILFEPSLDLLSRSYPRLTAWVPLLAFVLSIAIAALSFRYLETRFLRLKRVLAPQQPASTSGDTVTPTHLHVAEPAA